MPDNPTMRTGLAQLVAGACTDPTGHLVVADWLEEHLGRDDLAAVLRHSTADPRTPQGKAHSSFEAFRYAYVDAEVLLCMATWRVIHPNPAGSVTTRPQQQGHLVSLCISAESVGQLVRWVRWLTTNKTAAPEVLALWEQLSEEMPAFRSPSSSAPVPPNTADA